MVDLGLMSDLDRHITLQSRASHLLLRRCQNELATLKDRCLGMRDETLTEVANWLSSQNKKRVAEEMLDALRNRAQP